MNDDCEYKNDGECDPPLGYCAEGTDCADCDPVTHSPLARCTATQRANDDCEYKNDGECDPPLGYCAEGTDCADCDPAPHTGQESTTCASRAAVVVVDVMGVRCIWFGRPPRSSSTRGGRA